MNFSQLESLVALADTGSFTEAAEAVSLTQSAVSHALAALENELGVTLIDRSRKGMTALTSAGQKIIPHARALLAQAEAIAQEARSAQGLAMGRLRLGSIGSMINPALLAGVLTAFQQQYPDIEVVLFDGSMNEVGEWIENGVIDVSFALYPSKYLDTTLLAMDELCAVLPLGHRFQKRRALSPSDLLEEGFIMAKNECTARFMEIAGLHRDGRTPTIRYQATDSGTILAMVREGLGVTLLPRTVLPKKLEGMVALPLDPVQQLQIGLALPLGDAATPAAKLFVQTALTYIDSHAIPIPA